MYEFSELKTHGTVSGAISRAGLLVLLSPLPLVVVVFCSFVFGVGVFRLCCGVLLCGCFSV